MLADELEPPVLRMDTARKKARGGAPQAGRQVIDATPTATAPAIDSTPRLTGVWVCAASPTGRIWPRS